MATQTQKGKAFEYVCLKALEEALGESQEVVIKQTSSFETAKGFYEDLALADLKTAQKMIRAAKAAVKIIVRLEPKLEHGEEDSPLYLEIQEDAKGIAGDVRDVVCSREENDWEIGLSCKHNHTAVKHSRLSAKIDFGAMWFGKECSKEYFEAIEPIFRQLSQMREEGLKWSQVSKKDDTVYMPILDAFMEELNSLDKKYPGEIPTQLIRYLLGRNDFYKVITQDSKKLTTLQGYNLQGTLNESSGKIKPLVKVHPLKLPTKFYDISYKEKSKNTVIVTCDGGWALSFRIHNASTMVEPSLKFDVQLIGVPQGLHTQVEPWE